MLTTRYSLADLQKQEKQNYEALSGLIGFIRGLQRPYHKLTASTDFERYKRSLLAEATLINSQHTQKVAKQTDTQFNVTHYQRAILSASQENYRNMAILAAIKDLTPSALHRLVMLIRKNCIKISRKAESAKDEHEKQLRRKKALRLQESSSKAVVIAYNEPIESIL